MFACLSRVSAFSLAAVVATCAACGAPLTDAPTPANIVPMAGDAPSVELALRDPAWRLTGSGRIERDRLTFDYCCRAAGYAKRLLPEVTSAGPWELAIEHTNSECTTAVHVLLFTAHGTTPIANAVLDADKTGTAHIPFSAPATPVELRLYAEGGLRCCGTTDIRSVVLRRR